MRIAFGPALPVGTGGECEAFDVWLRTYVPAEEALERLRASLPADMQPQAARFVHESEASLSAGVQLGVYDVRVEGRELTAGSVQAALEQTLAMGTLAVEHRRKTKVYDLARSLPKEPRASDGDGCVIVSVSVRMGPEGSLRPEVLLNAALGAANVQGVVTEVTRTDMLVETEEGVWSRPA